MSVLHKRDVAAFLHDVAKARVAIVGDIMLDNFTYGASTRLSPEAPVPVVDVHKRVSIPGGAANVARNVRSLGGRADLYSVVGVDEHGRELKKLLREDGVGMRVVPLGDRMTTTKERIVVNGKHLARMDREAPHPISGATARLLINQFKRQIRLIDIVIFSDYAKGVITETLVRDFCRIAQDAGVPVIVDTKPAHAHFFVGKGITLFTPNSKEALEISGKRDHESAAAHLTKYFSTAILITKGSEGMTLYSGGDRRHVDAQATCVVDVSGCGDTVAATIALSLATGRSMVDAMHLASLAAGIVVQKPGTATVLPRELLKFV